MILVAVTNRASYPRCKTLIDALGGDARVLLMDPEPDILEQLAGVAIVSTSRVAGGGQAMAVSAAHMMSDTAMIIAQLRPKAVVCVGDRHEVLGVALAARCANVPVVHMHAGERSGAIDDSVRFAISAISDLLLVPHHDAYKELCYRGYHESMIAITGCPSIDLCDRVREDHLSEINAYGSGAELTGRDFYLAVYHPDTLCAIEENVIGLKACMNALSGRKTLWIRPSQHDAMGAQLNKLLNQRHTHEPCWRVARHVPHPVLLAALRYAVAGVGNSSMFFREAAYLGTQCLIIGARQRGRLLNRNIVVDLPEEKCRVWASIWKPGGGAEAAKAIKNRYLDAV